MPLMFLKRLLAKLALLTLSLVSFAHAANRDVRVLSSEPVTLDFRAPQNLAAMKSAPHANAVHFVAFGKAFNATIKPNASIEIPAGSSAVAYKGSIDGRANSWVRITRIGQHVHGLIFDGAELFAIEPSSDIGASADAAAQDPSQSTSIFRLADTQTDLGAEFCSSQSPAEEASGLAIFKSLSGESKTMLAEMQKSGARTRLQVSALMDWSFRTRYSSEAAANDAIVARINNVDGIFTSQLGIEVELAATVVPETQAVRVFNSTNSDTMLQTVARLRSETPALYASGTTHLFTGTDLDGKTIGIAYMDSVCGQRYAASLSEARDRGVWFDSLVAAHELGHGFGSPHDGEGECAATASTFLMSPTINGNDRFSQCSLHRIQSRMQTAACLVAIPIGDISLPASISEYHAQLGEEFSWSVTVSNAGNADSSGSRLQIAVPGSLTVVSAHASGGSCAVGGGTIDCDLGTLAVLENRTVSLTLRGTQQGPHSVTATASATTDLDSANNSVTATIRINPSIDMALSLNAPDTAAMDQSFTATFSVINRSSSIAAANVAVHFVLPVGLSLAGPATIDGIACQVQFQTLQCSMPSLAAGRTVSGTVALAAREAGAQLLSATLEGAFVDPLPLDNAVQRAIVVISATPTATASVGPADNSGGGSIGALSLGLLISFAFLRRQSASAL
jgi:hypothetical protein